MNYKKQNKGGIYDDFSVVKGYKTSGDAYFFLEVEKNLLRNFNMSVGGKISSPDHYQNLAMQ